MPDYLIKQRQGWYAVLEIPKALRPKFGKVRFKQTLQTDSLSRAKARVLPVVAEWKRLIELARHGHPDFEGELLQWREYQRNYRKRGLSDKEIEEIALDAAVNLHPDPERGFALYETTTGQRIFLPEHLDRYLAAQDLEKKTIDMKRRDLLLLSDRFQFADAIAKQELVVWVEETLMRQDGLSPATCRRIISAARGYWAYLERHHKLTLPFPFQGVVPAARRTKETVRDRRKGFSSGYLSMKASSSSLRWSSLSLLSVLPVFCCRLKDWKAFSALSAFMAIRMRDLITSLWSLRSLMMSGSIRSSRSYGS